MLRLLRMSCRSRLHSCCDVGVILAMTAVTLSPACPRDCHRLSATCNNSRTLCQHDNTERDEWTANKQTTVLRRHFSLRRLHSARWTRSRHIGSQLFRTCVASLSHSLRSVLSPRTDLSDALRLSGSDEVAQLITAQHVLQKAKPHSTTQMCERSQTGRQSTKRDGGHCASGEPWLSIAPR